MRLYEESKDHGYTKAILTLAQLNENQNFKTSFNLYDEAAHGEPYALYKLGEF